MGMATILQARSIVLLATGRVEGGVRRAAARTVRSRRELPASFLQLHGDVDIDARRAAAAMPAVGRRPTRQASAQFPRRGSTSSPIASRTESSAFFSRRSACGSVSPVFCMTIAALTFHFARLSSASASS